MAKLESILKSRAITLPTKVHLVKAMIFPVVMYGCVSRTIKKAECQRIDALELWCWRKLLRVPWAARRSNQSTLKEISPEYCLEGLMLKLKLQYFGHLMQRTDSLEKTLMLGKIEGRRRRGWQRMRWLDGITNLSTWVWASSRSWWWTGVRERFTGGRLRAASHKSSVPYQFLATGTRGMARCSQDWGHRMKCMHESPSGNILLITKLLSLDPLSWDTDCLLTLWPLLISFSLSNGCCMLVFWSLSLSKEIPCKTAYTYSQKDH